MKLPIYLTLLLAVFSFSFKMNTYLPIDAPVEDCAIMKKGKFKYVRGNKRAIIDINESTYTEFTANGVVKADINWVRDCFFQLTMTQVTLAGSPYQEGEVVKVEIGIIDRQTITLHWMYDHDVKVIQLTKVAE